MFMIRFWPMTARPIKAMSAVCSMTLLIACGNAGGLRRRSFGRTGGKAELAGCSEMGYVWGMTVEAIKEAIAGLPEEERHSLAVWLNEMDYDEWDKEMVNDFSPGGRGYHLVEKVKRDIAEGEARPMEEGFAARR
jgi:hypothetical protein